MRPTPKSGWVVITVFTGTDQHSLRLAGRTLARIRAGKQIHLDGQGFYVEGHREADSWTFNAAAPGSIHVDTDEGRDVFDGSFGDGEAWVEPQW